MHRRRGARALIGSSALALVLVAGACSTSADGSASDATLKPGRESGTTTTGVGETTTTDDGSSTTETGSGPTATSSTGPTQTTLGDPNDQLTLEEAPTVAVQSLVDYWERTYPTVIGGTYEPITDVFAVRSRNPEIECGGEVINELILANGGNALFCSDPIFIAYDARGLIPNLFRQIGDMAVLVAFAHEWGHSVSEQAEYFSRTTFGSEQQADCFAGSWAGDLAAGSNDVLTLSPGDLDEALTGLLALRDPPQVDPRSEGAHGSAFQRIDAFRRGFEGGAQACTTLHETPPRDLGAQGDAFDLELPELLPLTTQALDLYWAEEFTQLGGSTYTTITTMPFRGASAAPACSGLSADQIVGQIMYCPSGDFVAWDEDLVEELWEQGDFAVSAAIADAWSAGILARLKVPGDAAALGLQADCLAGAWTGAISRAEVLDEQGDAVVTLSPGDLDEAVAGFLFQSGTAGANASFDIDKTAAFDRTAAFQNGFENDASDCLG
jgi:predicted metalloprotease